MAPSMRELSAAEPLTEGVDSFRLAFGRSHLPQRGRQQKKKDAQSEAARPLYR